MLIGVSNFELHLPQSGSLKAKRKVVKGLIDRLHHRFRISIAETDYHDLHQRAELTLAIVALNEMEGQRLMDALYGKIDSLPEAVLTRWDPQWIEGDSG